MISTRILPKFRGLYAGLFILCLAFSLTGAGYKDSFFTVTRVIDGDTIKISNGAKVRLIGIDTPESYESAKLLRDMRRSGKDAATIKSMGKRRRPSPKV